MQSQTQMWMLSYMSLVYIARVVVGRHILCTLRQYQMIKNGDGAY